MTIVKCGVCGKRLNVTSNNAFDKITAHKKACKQKLVMAVGNYLSRKAEEYG